MQARGQNNEVLKLKDYHVQPNSTIYLLVLLYAKQNELDNVVFDFFWKYPHSGCNYLDASVLLYSGSQFVEVIDSKHTASQSCSGVKHSGDVMDHAKRSGRHSINVSIKSIPVHINKLVFTLSARNSPNISKYPNLSLKFFDANFPDKQLCSDDISHAVYSQAVIMCCLTNRGSGWQVLSLKNLSAGNAKNYEPLKKSIVGLIGKGYM
jgi:stress response protein SCP2